MRIAKQDPFIIKKFKAGMLIVYILSVLVACTLTFFIPRYLIKEQVKHDLISAFMGVNNSITSLNYSKTKPITEGILSKNEILYIVKSGRMLYGSEINKKKTNYRNLELVMAKQATKDNAVEVKLYVDINSRVNKYFKSIYIFVLPIILLMALLITLYSVSKLKKLTERLYSLIDNVKDFKTHGVDFNKIKIFNTDDEVGVLSKEFDKLSVELIKMRHKERQFVNDAAHELKTPLAIIEGNLSLIDKKSYSEEGKNVARELIKSTLFSAKALIDDMLDLNNEVIIVKEKLEEENISELLTQVIEDYKIIYTDFTFKTDLDPVMYPIIKLDFVKLSNILLENAVKYSTEDLKEIEVKIKKKGEKLLFSVTDYGMGMTRENVEKVFDKFWRADTSRARNTGGTGLGLSIAHKICEKYGFKISVASALNTGTTVTVEIG